MKNFLCFLFLFLILLPACASEDRMKRIECEMYCKTTSGNLYKEDVTRQIFVIDDEYKNLYIYSNGRQTSINGYVRIFDENEISYDNITTLQKETGELNINRQSGSIYIRLVKPNIWWGDMVMEYQGNCHKLEGNRF